MGSGSGKAQTVNTHMKISKARFSLSPFSSEQMAKIGTQLADTIRKRIASGVNVNDTDAKPLKPGRNNKRGYPDYKIAHSLQPIRDWTWSGRTLRSMKVISVNQNRGVIGFTDLRSDRVAHVNNAQEKMFGISPKDAQVLRDAVYSLFRTDRVIDFRKVA